MNSTDYSNNLSNLNIPTTAHLKTSTFIPATNDNFAGVIHNILELKSAIDILTEIDYKNLSPQILESICELIEEFDFNLELLEILDKCGIKAYSFSSPIPSDTKVVLRRDKGINKSNVYLQGQIGLELKRVFVNGKSVENGLEYFSGITFSEESSVLIFRENECTFSFIVTEEEINGVPVSFIESVETIDWEGRYNNKNTIPNHVFITKWNKIFPISFSDYGFGTKAIGEDDIEVPNTGTEQIVFFLDEQKTAFIAFNGEGFSPVKRLHISNTGLGDTGQKLN